MSGCLKFCRRGCLSKSPRQQFQLSRKATGPRPEGRELGHLHKPIIMIFMRRRLINTIVVMTTVETITITGIAKSKSRNCHSFDAQNANNHNDNSGKRNSPYHAIICICRYVMLRTKICQCMHVYIHIYKYIHMYLCAYTRIYATRRLLHLIRLQGTEVEAVLVLPKAVPEAWVGACGASHRNLTLNI